MRPVIPTERGDPRTQQRQCYECPEGHQVQEVDVQSIAPGGEPFCPEHYVATIGEVPCDPKCYQCPKGHQVQEGDVQLTGPGGEQYCPEHNVVTIGEVPCR